MPSSLSTARSPRLAPRRHRLIKNLGWLFSSQVLVGLIGLASLALAARALGPAALGLLALVEAYARIVARLVHLEPWQASIKFGSDALEQGDDARLSGIFYMSVVIDLIGGVLAGALAMACAPLLVLLTGAENLTSSTVFIAALGVFVSLRATGVGALRLFDRFDVLARTDVASAVLRLALYATGFALGFGLTAFVVFFVVISLFDGLLAFVLARREMARRGVSIRPVALSDFKAANPRFFAFVWNSNLSVIFRQLAQRLDVMILAALVSPTALGFYHIARRSSEAALRLGRPLNQAIYPEFTRLVSAGNIAQVRRLAMQIFAGFALVLTAALVPIVLNLDALIDVVLGADFADSATVVATQAVAVAIFLAGMIFNPALLSLSRDRFTAYLSLAAAVLFFALLFPMVSTFGVVGASLSHLIANALWLIACLLVVWSATRQTPDPAEAAAS